MPARTSADSTMSPLTFHEQFLKAHDTGGKRSPEFKLSCMSPSVENESGKVTNNWPDFTYVYEEATQGIDPDDYAFTQLNRSDMTEAAE